MIAVFPVQIDGAKPGTRLRLSADAKVVLDRGVEKGDDPPVDAPNPVILGWETKDGGRFGSGGESLDLDAGTKEVLVLVAQPSDTAVTVEVDMVEVI